MHTKVILQQQQKCESGMPDLEFPTIELFQECSEKSDAEVDKPDNSNYTRPESVVFETKPDRVKPSEEEKCSPVEYCNKTSSQPSNGGVSTKPTIIDDSPPPTYREATKFNNEPEEEDDLTNSTPQLVDETNQARAEQKGGFGFGIKLPKFHLGAPPPPSHHQVPTDECSEKDAINSTSKFVDDTTQVKPRKKKKGFGFSFHGPSFKGPKTQPNLEKAAK